MTAVEPPEQAACRERTDAEQAAVAGRQQVGVEAVRAAVLDRLRRTVKPKISSEGEDQ